MTTYATLEDIENCMNNGWTDGLPVIPPYGSIVDEMLDAMGWRGQDVIGEIASQDIVIRAEKAAATAVMAGCKPAYGSLAPSASIAQKAKRHSVLLLKNLICWKLYFLRSKKNKCSNLLLCRN